MWDEEEHQQDQASDMNIVPAVGHEITGITPAPANDGSLLSTMVTAAQSIVRDPKKLITNAKQIGGLLAASAFYRFPTGGQTVEGASIDLAQALAQEWGAITYQVNILRSEPLGSGGKRLHLRARVIDMRTLVAAEVDQVITTSQPPGRFAQKADQVERWHAMQAQSAASKIVRNAILRVLPAWYVDAALESAKKEDARRVTDGRPLPEMRAGAVKQLEDLGVSKAELEAHVGQPVDLWAIPQLAMVRDLKMALSNGATSVEQFRASVAAKSEHGEPKPAKSALGIPNVKPAEAKPAEPGNDDTGANPADAEAFERAQQEKRAQAGQAPAQGTLKTSTKR